MTDKERKAAIDAGVNWRAIEIEEAETRLKSIIKNGMLRGDSRRQISHDSYTEIYRIVRDIDNEELAKRCAMTFPRYADRVFADFAQVFSLLSQADRDMIAQSHGIPEQRELPDYAYERGVAAQKYGLDYQKEVNLRLRNVAALAAREDYESNVSLRNVAEMQIRYEKHLDELDELKRRGVKLVWVSTHANCSRRCERWQGRCYSLDGTTGRTADGTPYIPLEKAVNIPYTTKRGVTYMNGLFGFNCRHKITEYTPGSKPITIPKDVIAKTRKLEEQQRAFEREIRYQKNLYYTFKDIDKQREKIALAARKRAIMANRRYKAFCAENNLPYPIERTRVLENEKSIFARRVSAD